MLAGSSLALRPSSTSRRALSPRGSRVASRAERPSSSRAFRLLRASLISSSWRRGSAPCGPALLRDGLELFDSIVAASPPASRPRRNASAMFRPRRGEGLVRKGSPRSPMSASTHFSKSPPWALVSQASAEGSTVHPHPMRVFRRSVRFPVELSSRTMCRPSASENNSTSPSVTKMVRSTSLASAIPVS